MRLIYFGGALDAALAASVLAAAALAVSAAAAAFFRDSFSACFLSAATLRGLVLGPAELSLELARIAPGVLELPGVPGVRPFPAPDGAADFASPEFPPSPGETCPQALTQINAASGNTAFQIVRVDTVISSCIQKKLRQS